MIHCVYTLYSGLFFLGGNFSKFHQISRIGSQLVKVYSELLYKVWLWVAIVTLVEFCVDKTKHLCLQICCMAIFELLVTLVYCRVSYICWGMLWPMIMDSSSLTAIANEL